MRRRSVLPALALAASGLLCPFAATPAEAADPPENDLAVVANQDASATCNVGWTTALDQHVVLANPVTGALVRDLGKPANITGVLNEAKPFDHNNQIVALWGPSGGGRGGVGVYDLKQNAWTKSFELPTNFGGGNGVAHSVTWLTGDKFAVAQTGTIGTSPQWGYVVLFDATGAQVQPPIPMKGAHGVEWDGATTVYAVGDDHVAEYAFLNGTLTERDSWQLPLGPDGKRGGHDLRRRRTDSKYFVTTNGASWVFDPAIEDDAAAFTEVRRSAGTPLSGVKSMDQRFDGRASYSFIPNPMFYFLDPAGERAAQFCAKPYKVRWLYGNDQPMYRETAAATTTVAPAREPFLWELNRVLRGATQRVSGQIWVGEGAGDFDDTKAADKIHAAYANGANPDNDAVYVKFYFFGDSGVPNIYKAHQASAPDFDQWRGQARAIAQAIGNRPAYVVIEPEWDANPQVCERNDYRRALIDVVGAFRTYAKQAVLINGVGLWKADSVYQCFASTDAGKYPGTTNLHKLFNAHGMLMHLVSSVWDCTRRDPGHFLYNSEPNYPDALTFQGARDFIANLDNPTTHRAFPRLRRLLGANSVYLTDVAITDCGWGESGQTTLFNDLAAQLVPLYESQGLRGASFRSGGPDKTECYMGVKNERGTDGTSQGGFRYNNNPGVWNPDAPVNSAIETGRATMQDYVNSGQQPADPPTFTSVVTAPATAKASGGSITIGVELSNKGGALTDGIVDLEIYAPNGLRADNGQKIWEHENIAAGANASYSYSWPVPATTGTYRVKVGVFSAGWITRHYWNDNADNIVVDTTGSPAFTASATASPAVIAPDATTSISATVSNSGGPVTGATVKVYVASADGRVISAWPYDLQDFPTGTSRTDTPTFTAPPTGGEYAIGVAVTAAGGSPGYYENPAAGTVTVSTSKFTSSATATRTVVRPDGATTVTATVQNTGTTALDAGIVDLYLYDNATTQQVSRQTLTGESFAVGQTKTYTWPVTMPATVGAYTVKIGVFTGGWSVQHWNDRALTLSVAQPSFTVSAMTTPSRVQSAGPLTIGTTVTNVGGHLDGAVVDVEVFDATGNRVTGGQQFWSGQSLGHGETKSFSWPWTAPAALGTYTVKVGVFATSGTTWTTRYAWADRADTFTVEDPAFVTGADLSSATVAPGGTVTITASFENVGGSMTNGITDIQVWNPAGTKDAQRSFTGQSLEHGKTSEYTYTWTAPATPGTYTVKLAAFNSTWAKTYHWNNGAATITVGGATFQPTFRVGAGANTWWIEIYTSNDVTGVDAIADNGRFYLPLTKRSWGAWAATAPSELPNGSPIQLVARRSSDGASASSNPFTWRTSTPTTAPGWVCSLTKGTGSSPTWVEVVACASPTTVEVKAGTGAWTALTYSATSGKWGRAMAVTPGTKVVFRAKRADNAWAYSTVYTW